MIRSDLRSLKIGDQIRHHRENSANWEIIKIVNNPNVAMARKGVYSNIFHLKCGEFEKTLVGGTIAYLYERKEK